MVSDTWLLQHCMESIDSLRHRFCEKKTLILVHLPCHRFKNLLKSCASKCT